MLDKGTRVIFIRPVGAVAAGEKGIIETAAFDTIASKPFHRYGIETRHGRVDIAQTRLTKIIEPATPGKG